MFSVFQIKNLQKNFSLWLYSLFVFSFLSLPLHAETNASVAAGENHSLLLRTDGSLWSMGKNDRGQRGDGSELERGLVGWWKFDGDATDSSGNGNDGAVNGATLTTDRHGQANSAYSFDGVNDYLSMTIGTYNEVTFSAWVKIASFNNGYPKLFDLGSSFPLFRIGFNGNRPDHLSAGIVGRMSSYRSSFSLHTNILSYGIQPIGSWINVVTSLGIDSFHSTFLDGILIEQGSYKDSPSLDGSLKIGANNGLGSDHFFNGSIDDVRIYNRALLTSEVSDLYTLESQPFSHQPARVVDENVTAIASGSENSYFIKKDGSLWGMGRNDRGQLGNAQGLDQGLVGWWKFDGDATDSSGNGNDGTVNGATLTTDRHGQANWAYSFDGVNDYIEVPYNSTLNGAKSSYTLWCRVDALSSDWASPLTTRQSPPKGGFAVYKSKDNNFWQLMIGRQNNSWSIQESTIPVVQGNWVFISVTIDAPNANFFVDGVLAQNFSDLALNTLSPMYFGAGATEVASPRQYYFNGAIDDIRIYDRALSASEVSALYTLESQPEDPSSPIQIVDSNVTAVSSRGSHALFQKTDGTLWAMGSNAYGQLGDGTTTDRHTPMQVFAWEEKASNSLARSAFDGVEVMDGKLYFAGGYSGLASAVFESFDPSTGSWQTLPSLATARIGISMAAYNGKLYVFGGSTANGSNNKLDSMEIYNSDTNSWSAGPNLPVACNYSVAVTYGDKILVFGGWDQPQDNMDQVLEFDPSLNTWSSKTSMPVGRSGMKAVVFEGKVWLMGGLSGSGNEYSNRVDVYDPATDTWSQMPDLTVARHWALAWTENGQVYIGGGRPDVSTYLTTIESYDSSTNQWRIVGNLPFGAYQTDTALINGKLYLSGGYDGSSHSNKLYMTDLNPVRAFSAGGDHSRFVQADGSLWAMGRNNYGQLGMSDWPTNGMTAYYPFDGDALDMSGNGYDGLVVGATLTPDRFGNPDMAYSFDGSDDRIRIGNQSLNGSNSFTITMWIKFLNGSRHFFSAANSVRQNEFLLDINSDKLILSTKDQLRLHNSSFSITSWYGNWKQLAMTRSNSSSGMDVYLDGQFLETFAMASGAPVVDSNGLWLGADQDSVGGGWASDNMFLGSMDEIRIFNRELSSAEITKLYDLENRSSPVKIETVKWEEKASHSQARYAAYDGVEVIDGKLYFAGGSSATVSDTLERYDPITNQWTALAPMTQARSSQFTTNHNGLLYLFGGKNGSALSSLEIYDPSSDSWSSGVSIPNALSTTGVKAGDKVFLVSGANDSAELTQVLEFDLNTSVWTTKAPLTTARSGHVCAYYDGKIWAMGGRLGGTTHLDSVEIYDPATNSWTVGPSLTTPRFWAVGWVAKGRMYVAGGRSGASFLNTIESYNPDTNSWELVGNLPVSSYLGNVGVIDNKAYLVVGATSHGVYSDKFYVADYSPVTGVASGQSHGYYLKGSGDLWSMGLNADGQLGDGTTTNRNSPVQVLNGSNVNQVSAGSKEGYFIKEDGTAWAMGRNDYGQLGKADTASQSTPAMVFGWEEKASVSVARFVSNGLVTLGNAIYCVGGYSSSTVYKLLEKYDPQTGQWENLRSMTQSREGLASAVLDGKIYALGGVGFANSEIYDPVADSWSAGPDLPEVIHRACAVTYNNRLFLMGGQRANDSYLNQVLEFNSTSNQWVIRSPMPNVRSGHKLIVFQNAVWAIGGSPSGSFVKVDRYVPETDTWSSMPDMITGRSWGVTWVLGDRLYAGGGSNGSYLKSVESFDPVSNQWQEVGEFPQISYASGFAQLGNKLFLVGGGVSTGVFSDKLYVSDLSPIQAVASNGNSNPNTILIKQDGTFWGMGRNDSGQIGDGSLSNRSYPVPIISSYTLVVNGAPEGNATGGGEWSIGSPVTLTATPNPGYLFSGWTGDLNSTDANVTITPSANMELNATFEQDLNDNDDDNLTNFYEIVTLGTNADNNDTDGDGLPDGVEDGVLGIDPLVDNALIVDLFAQREIDAHEVGLAEGNTSGQQYVYDYRSTFSLYNQTEVNASALERVSNGSLTGEPLGRLYVQTNPAEFNLYTEADLNASMDSERVRGIADGNLSGTSQVVANPTAYGLYSEAEVNASLLSEYNRGVSEGNASGWSYLQSNRLAYSLFNSSDLNTSGDLAYAQGVDEGNTSGIAYAVTHPSEFSLHTSADLNESGVLFRANGVQDGNASGQSHVLNNLSSFQLFTESELNDTRLVELELGRAEGNQSGMSYVLANPHEFNLFESIDLNRSGDAEYLRGQPDGDLLGRSYVQANPNLYQLFTQSDLNVTATLSHQSGRGEGNASGITYLQTHARDYGLYTRTDRELLIAQARSEGLAEGNASGIAQVQASPANYSLLSLSEAEQVRQSTRQLALSDGFQMGVDWVRNNPRLYNLFDSAQRTVLMEQAKSEGHSEGLQAGEAYVLSRPGEFGWLDDPTRSALEESARLAAYYQGLENGKVLVLNDPAGYSLFTTTQRDAIVQSTYASSFMEGNTSGIATVFANRLSLGLSADHERDERIRLSGELGYSVGNAAGRAEALATAQADLSAQGLHLVEYLEQTELTPYTYNWFYQPGAGWLWTDKSTFPYLYLSTGEGGYQTPSGGYTTSSGGNTSPGGTQSRWLYYDANRTNFPFYDYQQKLWKEIEP